MVKQSAIQSFPNTFDAPQRSRSFVTATLATWHRPLPQHHAQLIVTELVTNALLHATGDIGVCLELVDDCLRINVVDTEPHTPPTLGKPHGDGGYGLNIVDALSDTWGYETTNGHKTVWAQLILAT